MAELRSKAQAITILKEAESYKEQQEIIADTEAKIIRENAEARLEVAKSKSAALIKEASAEKNNAQHMQPQRKHTEKMKLTGSMINVS